MSHRFGCQQRLSPYGPCTCDMIDLRAHTDALEENTREMRNRQTIEEEVASLRSQLARSEEVRKQLAGALRECAGFFDGPASADRRGFEGLCETALAASSDLDKAPAFDPATMPHDHDHLEEQK